jgi:hypothetical protein
VGCKGAKGLPFILHVSPFTSTKQPGLFGFAFELEGLDLLDVLEREADLVEAVE